MARPYYVYGGNLLDREKYTSVVNTTYGERRYFSSIDTDVYFGDILVDEMVAFDFIVEEKKMPIFGYNNFTPKRLLTGQKTIQGSFAINFTQTFNLKLLIDGLPDSIYANTYEDAIFYCGDDNQALFGKGFDITLSYGEAKAEGSYNACTQTLVGCYITSYRQAFDTSGEPILDMYTFIAKDLLIHTTAEEEIPEVEDDISVDTELGPDEPDVKYEFEPWKVANNAISEESDELWKYWKEHPETICIELNPTYDYIKAVSRISLFVCPLNDIELLYDSITIQITDPALKGSYSFKLDERIDTYNFFHKLTGTESDVGTKIKKLFADGNDFLECTVIIQCNDRKNDYPIEYSTRLHCGTIETIYNG